jgi:hypothetical protein
MSPQRLGALSSENPKAVLAWFGLVETPRSAQPVTPSQTSLIPAKPDDGVKKPEFSLISGPGATDRNRKAKMAEIKADVYKRLGVEL